MEERRKKLLFENILMKTFTKLNPYGKEFPRIHEQDGKDDVERINCPFLVEVSQGNHFISQFDEVDNHNTSVTPTWIETAKYGTLDSDDQSDQRTFLRRKLLLRVEHCIM